MKEFKNGLMTGLTLQLAIGPVFFFIVNLAIQKTIADGFAGVLAVTLVDYIYITLSILGIGKLLEYKKNKKLFGIVSSIVLIIFGIIILKGIIKSGLSNTVITTTNIFTSFASVFFITISSPMTIVFFTSLFAAKAVEYNYTKKELMLFGLGTGFATFTFMSIAVISFSLLGGIIPVLIIKLLNGIVGCLLIGYGLLRLEKLVK